jgi:hypothetical protein
MVHPGTIDQYRQTTTPSSEPVMPSRRLSLPSLVAAALCALVAAGDVAQAQRAGDGFLFGAPKATLALRGGFAQPRAGSDVFDFTMNRLTLDRGDFAGETVGAELGIVLGRRTTLQFGVASMRRTAGSEYRDWVDDDDRPIEQETTFRRVPVTAGLRLYLTPPGRSISRLAWIPARFTPYVAAGGGAMWYAFQQTGDFVDFETLDVFATTVRSSGWTSTGYAAAGVLVSLSPRFALTTEARHDRARGAMGGDFVGFDRIDLSGFGGSVGLEYRF